ncbi:MAG: hypothetical protein M3280_12485 [Actinomycetota bacterium]|nr:hypothetical protein [Actinomycetota bacterium]
MIAPSRLTRLLPTPLLLIMSLGLGCLPAKAAVPEGRLLVSDCSTQVGRHFEECLQDDATGPGSILEGPTYAYREVFSLEGEDRAQLTENDFLESRPVWSPNGSRVVFSVVDRQGEWDACQLGVMAASGGDVDLITPDVGGICSRPEDWSLYSEKILLTADVFDGPTDLYEVRPDGSDLRRLVSLGDRFHVSGAFWIARRKLIMAGHFPGRNGIYLVDARTCKRRLLNAYPPGTVFTRGFDISPNRRWVAYAAHDQRASDRIIVMRVDGTHKTRLTYNRPDLQLISFSPSGSRLLFEAGDWYSRRPDGRLFVVDLGTGSITKLGLPRNMKLSGDSAVWSPSGRYVAFHAFNKDASQGAVYAARSDGSKVIQLTDSYRDTGYIREVDVLSWTS